MIFGLEIITNTVQIDLPVAQISAWLTSDWGSVTRL